MPERLTWLGHSAFRLERGREAHLHRPLPQREPEVPRVRAEPERVDVIAITHGHGDHVGDTVELAKKHGCTVIAPVELADWLGTQGVENVLDPNKGGTVAVDGVALHDHERAPLELEQRRRVHGRAVRHRRPRSRRDELYFAGDTCVFGDMAMIGRLYKPDLAVLPIGDYYTMDPEEAALALELLGVKRCVPCHWGTFPPLSRTAGDAAGARAGREGGDARARRVGHHMRERWWGASGRQRAGARGGGRSRRAGRGGARRRLAAGSC